MTMRATLQLTLLVASSFALNSQASSQPAELSPVNQKLVCAPTANAAEASFQKLDLAIDAQGKVSGRYMSSENEESRSAPVSLDDQSVWMTADPVQASLSDGKIKMVFDFHGHMGNDEDIYTLLVDPKSGAATMKVRYMADCGDGRYHNSPSEEYTCTAE
jgi:hypothetical protein